MSLGGIKKIFQKLYNKFASKQETDKILITIAGILIITGLIMLSSASSVVAYNKYGDSYYFFKHQLFAYILGIGAFWFFSKFNYKYLKKYALAMLFFSIILLILVFIPSLAREVHGSRSWIEIFGFNLQPSEFVKLTFLIYLSAWFASKQDKHQQINASQKSKPFFLLFALIAGLMLMQPDLGTLIIISIISFTVYLVGGGKIKYILTLGVIGLLGLALLVSINEYQQNRFKCVLDPSFSPQKYCYQVNQSLIAVGSGGLFGRGLGASRQKFLYLPEVQNDFIFSIIGEELGFFLSSLIIILFFILFYRGYIIAKKINDDFGRNLSIGIVTWLMIQAVINIGGIINLLPMTGVPLPFISYGGTAVLSAMIGLGILANISKQAGSK